MEKLLAQTASLRIAIFVGYDIEDTAWYYAIVNRDYRKHENEFLNDRRRIPLKWVQAAIGAWKKRGKDWFSAPFDGVWDFNLTERL